MRNAVAATLRAEAWTLERDIGIEHVPSNDFSLYDHVLDHAAMFGVVPKVMWSKLIPVDEFNCIQQATNCVLIQTGRQNVLIDTGYGSKLRDKERALLRADPGPVQCPRDGGAAQLAGRLAGEGAQQAAHRRPRAAEDEFYGYKLTASASPPNPAAFGASLFP